jgi:hypothetical protein
LSLISDDIFVMPTKASRVESTPKPMTDMSQGRERMMRPWAQIISAVDGTDYLSLQLAWFTIF